jgi:hypothetical protein
MKDLSNSPNPRADSIPEDKTAQPDNDIITIRAAPDRTSETVFRIQIAVMAVEVFL